MSQMKRIGRAEIAAAPDVKQVDVEVPEWDGMVSVRGLQVGEALDLRAAHTAGKLSEADMLIRILSLALVDEKGQRLFSDSEEDQKALRAKNTLVVSRLAGKAMELSGLTEAAVKADAENLPGAQTGASSAS